MDFKLIDHYVKKVLKKEMRLEDLDETIRTKVSLAIKTLEASHKSAYEYKETKN